MLLTKTAKMHHTLTLISIITFLVSLLTGCKEEAPFLQSSPPDEIPLSFNFRTFNAGEDERPQYSTIYQLCRPDDVCNFNLETYASIENYTPEKGTLTLGVEKDFPSYTDCLVAKPRDCSWNSEVGQLIKGTKCIQLTPDIHFPPDSEEAFLGFAIRFYQPSTNKCYVSQPYIFHVYKGFTNQWYTAIYPYK